MWCINLKNMTCIYGMRLFSAWIILHLAQLCVQKSTCLLSLFVRLSTQFRDLMLNTLMLWPVVALHS
jgi:hypothetical protein